MASWNTMEPLYKHIFLHDTHKTPPIFVISSPDLYATLSRYMEYCGEIDML